METKFIHPLVLAYVGDSVLEILTREHIVSELKILKPQLLQNESIYYVSAKAQESFMKYALKEKLFTEEELTFYARGKNAKDTRSLKNTSQKTHRISSGFEAILGHLHLTGQNERIREIFECYKIFVIQKRNENETNLRQK
ncbi:MAG: ribonuclease III [Erysipelotrichaceae bacterium]|nr:ribonuclease III [Erysipelotrichaceae bacterium]